MLSDADREQAIEVAELLKAGDKQTLMALRQSPPQFLLGVIYQLLPEEAQRKIVRESVTGLPSARVE